VLEKSADTKMIRSTTIARLDGEDVLHASYAPVVFLEGGLMVARVDTGRDDG
jgi:hypothetical protein